MPSAVAEQPQEGTRDSLRARTVRGSVASGFAQIITLGIRTGSIVVLSRLLPPRDFGLIAMATAATGFLSLFRDFGLATASVQRSDLTEEQASTLFWLNVSFGAGLALTCAALAPLLVGFYGDSRLQWITVALGSAFLFNGASAQHRALLQRRMQFGTLAVVDIAALLGAVLFSVAAALGGAGYWAVVVMAVFPPFGILVGVWACARWTPGRARSGSGVGSLIRFGGTLTLNGFIVYLAYNVDKVLLGRVWGAEVLGLYSRAYQLMNLSTEGLNSAVSQVALPALARLQGDPQRRRRYFLQGYKAFLAIAMPVTVATWLFAEDIVGTLLGQGWRPAARILRLLTPTMLVFAIVNPLAWLLLSAGRTGRSLVMALLIAPVTIIAFLIGVNFGAEGVAIGFSSAMVLLAPLLVLIGTRGMNLGWRDIVASVAVVAGPAALGAVVAAGVALLLPEMPIALRLVIETTVLASVCWATLLLTDGRAVYWKILDDTGLLNFVRRRWQRI
jgi:PST family polysaccharide transporter